jgi:hypothetical protein
VSSRGSTAVRIALLVCALLALAAGSGQAVRSRHVSATGCAFQLPNQLANKNASASSTLVPPTARSLLLCRYGGLSAGPNVGRLAASASVESRATIVRLTDEFDALPRLRSGIHCPFDDASAILVTFGYELAAADPVQVGLKGCRVVSNGRLTRTAASDVGAQLVAQLVGLLEPHHSGVALAACKSAQLRTSVLTQGENTTAWIGVTVQNRGRACVLARAVGRVSLLVEQSGHPANVGGNPLTLFASGALQRGGTRLLIADWGNWCGSRRAIRLTVTLAGSTTRARFSILPVCLQPRRRSRLSAVH